MARKQKKFGVEIGGMGWGKKDTAKLSLSAKFDSSGMDANEVQALLAAGQLHCRLDRAIGAGQLPLPKTDMPATTVEFDATCHRIGMDLSSFSFGLSFPKTAAQANTLADFSGQDAKLIVTRTGDLDSLPEEGDEPDEADEKD